MGSVSVLNRGDHHSFAVLNNKVPRRFNEMLLDVVPTEQLAFVNQAFACQAKLIEVERPSVDQEGGAGANCTALVRRTNWVAMALKSRTRFVMTISRPSTSTILSFPWWTFELVTGMK